jgi:outer membrane protein insertion porin family
MTDENIEVSGISKTKKEFLKKIFKNYIAGDTNGSQNNFKGCLDLLNSLNIFSKLDYEISSGKCKIQVEEKKRKINAGVKMGSLSDLNGYIKLFIPNIFGNAENLDLDLSTNKNLKVRLTKPLVCRGAMSFLEFFTVNAVKKIPDKSFDFIGYTLGIIKNESVRRLNRKTLPSEDLSKYYLSTKDEYNNKDLKHVISTESGVYTRESKTFPFFKVNLFSQIVRRSLGKYYNKFTLRMGSAYGKIHPSDKFFLGKFMRGYKEMSISPVDRNEKIGGKSYIEICHQLGCLYKDMDFHVFSNLGFCSRQSNLVETVKSATLSVLLLPKLTCLGLSVGAGISIPLDLNFLDVQKIEGSFAIPLAKNDNVEMFQLSVGADF